MQIVRQDEQSLAREAKRLERKKRLLVGEKRMAESLKRKVAEEEEHECRSTKRRDVEISLTFPGFMVSHQLNLILF